MLLLHFMYRLIVFYITGVNMEKSTVENKIEKKHVKNEQYLDVLLGGERKTAGRPRIPNKPEETQVRIYKEDKDRYKRLIKHGRSNQADITRYLLECHDELDRIKKNLSGIPQ